MAWPKILNILCVYVLLSEEIDLARSKHLVNLWGTEGLPNSTRLRSETGTVGDQEKQKGLAV